MAAVVDLRKLREEIASVGAGMSYIDLQVEHVHAAFPVLDIKIQYARLRMTMSTLPLNELHNLKLIHVKLMQFWESLSRKQLKKLAHLSDCMTMLLRPPAPLITWLGFSALRFS
uniref:Uncharacterized protein n=1 Tax=Physcomitrium patens TaxID=3218 RepID=A0A2K1IAT8_PHYPA|nr:hypothetical protein PHYPA_030953 [Physcomitrium patens]